jgi:hypothetical protein
MKVLSKSFIYNLVLASFMCERKYYVILQNGGCSREINVLTLDFRKEVRYQKATPLESSIWKRSTLR